MQKFFFNGRINLRMIRCFLVLAEELHFGKAAERLHISQPPLSAIIKELEDVLGFRLFTRDSRNVELTRAGIMMQHEMQQVWDNLEQALSRVCEVGRYQQQHINIGVIGSAVWDYLLNALKECQQTMPDMTWSLHELSPHQQQEALLRNTIDVGIWRCADLDVNITFKIRCINKQNIVLAVHKDNPLSRHEIISLEQLNNQIFIFLTFIHSRFSQEIYNLCVKSKCQPREVIQTKEPQTQMTLVKNNLGIALVPQDTMIVPWPDVRFIPLEQDINADIYAVYNPNNLSPVLTNFLAAFCPF